MTDTQAETHSTTTLVSRVIAPTLNRAPIKRLAPSQPHPSNPLAKRAVQATTNLASTTSGSLPKSAAQGTHPISLSNGASSTPAAGLANPQAGAPIGGLVDLPFASPVSRPVGSLPSNGTASHGAAPSKVFAPEDYSKPQKYMIDAAMRSAGFDGNQRDAVNLRVAFSRAQARNLGMSPAAYANNIIRQVESLRAHAVEGVTLLDTTPYVEPKGAFAASFLSSMIECAPETLAVDAPPSDELRAASEAVDYEYLCSFMTSARPNDFACASGRKCFGMRLFDDHNHALPPTVWKVFFKPSEMPDVLSHPERFESDAKTRFCIGCKLELAVNRVYTIRAHNACMRPNVLACDIHVLVDLQGEFPIAATIGFGSNGYHGLVQNIPRISRVGWRVEPDSQCLGCYVYHWSVPRFPVPAAYYTRDAADGIGGPSF